MPIIPSIPIYINHTNSYHPYQFIPFIPIHTNANQFIPFVAIHTNAYQFIPSIPTITNNKSKKDFYRFKNCKKCANYNKCAKETKFENNERKIMSSCHRPTTLKACPSPVLRHVYFTLVLQLKFLYQIAESQLCHDH